MRAARNIITLLFLLSNCLAFSQEKGTGPKEKSFKTELKSNKQFRFEQKEKRRKERAEKKAIKKYHKRLQTKKVRKRMKASKQKSLRINDNRRESFFSRMGRKFQKKGRVKKRL